MGSASGVVGASEVTVMVTSPVEGVIDVGEAEVPRGGLLMTANFWAADAIVETAGLADGFSAGDDRCETLLSAWGSFRFADLDRSQSAMKSGSESIACP